MALSSERWYSGTGHTPVLFYVALRIWAAGRNGGWIYNGKVQNAQGQGNPKTGKGRDREIYPRVYGQAAGGRLFCRHTEGTAGQLRKVDVSIRGIRCGISGVRRRRIFRRLTGTAPDDTADRGRPEGRDHPCSGTQAGPAEPLPKGHALSDRRRVSAQQRGVYLHGREF